MFGILSDVIGIATRQERWSHHSDPTYREALRAQEERRAAADIARWRNAQKRLRR